MNGTQTIEVRWFFPGSLPDEIRNWFDTLGDAQSPADSRSDFYLQSSSPDLGVKIRQGNLEVKHLQQQFDRIEVARLGEGKVEQWSKWICDDSPGERLRQRAAHSPQVGEQGWIQVDKIRQQRFYRVEFIDSIQLTPIDTPRQNAAAIEITDLRLRGESWWTIACEYLGDNISIDRQFSPLVCALLLKYPLLISTQSISCSYPQWLSANN